MHDIRAIRANPAAFDAGMVRRGLPPAAERLLALDKAEDLLNRDILTLDLRHQQRPTLRLAPAALREMRRAMGLVTVENDL